jgi:virginiamycin A acetyltransferase
MADEKFKRYKYPLLYKISPQIYDALFGVSIFLGVAFSGINLCMLKRGYEKKFKKSKIYFNLPLFQDQIKIDVGVFSFSHNEVTVAAPTNSKEEYKLKIGNYVQIGRNLNLIMAENHTPLATSNHMCGILLDKWTDKMRDLYNKNYKERYGDIVIGNDVWIGDDVTILGGVKIGDGAIIGTKSLVNKDIPKFSIYAGIPARLIRFRFSKSVCKALDSIKWWEWEEGKIEKRIADFYDIGAFIKKYRKG